MKEKIIINPKYEYLRDFIETLPTYFEHNGETIYKSRNEIKKIVVGELMLNVKRYANPSFFHKFVYSFLRTPKGQRAFDYPAKLLAKDFETPEPVAYLEQKSCGLIGYSYFVSLHVPYQANFYQFGDASIDTCREVVIAFAKYTAALHKAGILHKDYSPGNILFDRIENAYRFCLVDINRMYFGNVSIEQGCANFARLWGEKEFFVLLAEEYATARGADKQHCVDRILHYRGKFWKNHQRKHPVPFHWEL